MYKTGDIIDGRYEIKEQIGSGGDGIVYKAYHIGMKKDVAVKLIKNISSDELENRSEIDLMKDLKSKYLPVFYDFINENGAVYTVMEYIDGHDIKSLVEMGREFDEKTIIRCGKQLCCAAEEIHSQKPPIIHGDIKPSNVMMTAADNICLIDFNISAVMQGNRAAAKGYSKEYAAPEQTFTSKNYKIYVDSPIEDEFHEETRFLFNDTSDHAGALTKTLLDENDLPDEKHQKAQAFIDFRTDIFGIGAVLYYMVTGHPPINGKPDFSEVTVSAKLKGIITKAMAPNPDDRFKAAEEMKASFDSDKVEKIKSSSGSNSINKKMIAGIACAAAVVLVVGGIIAASSKVKTDDMVVSTANVLNNSSESINYQVSSNTTASETTLDTQFITESTEMVLDTSNSETFNDIPTYPLSVTILGTEYNVDECYKLTLNNPTEEDIKKIDELVNLRELTIKDSELSDLSLLHSLKKLEHLDISFNTSINDFTFLAELTNLKSLNLSGTNISDLYSIKDLKNLQYLDLAFCYNLNSISGINKFEKIIWLNISHCKSLHNIDDLSGIECLEVLVMDALNTDMDLTPIEKLDNLQILSIGDNAWDYENGVTLYTKYDLSPIYNHNILYVECSFVNEENNRILQDKMKDSIVRKYDNSLTINNFFYSGGFDYISNPDATVSEAMPGLTNVHNSNETYQTETAVKEYDFGKINWGMTKDEVKANEPREWKENSDILGCKIDKSEITEFEASSLTRMSEIKKGYCFNYKISGLDSEKFLFIYDNENDLNDDCIDFMEYIQSKYGAPHENIKNYSALYEYTYWVNEKTFLYIYSESDENSNILCLTFASSELTK